jgi:hypothetical protein
MKCKNIRHIFEYSTGILPRELECEIKEHIKKCPTCQEAYYLFSFTHSFIKSGVEADKSIDARIIQSVDKNLYTQKNILLDFKRRFYALKPVIMTAAAFIAILTGIFSIMLYKSSITVDRNGHTPVSSQATALNTTVINSSPGNDLIKNLSIEDLKMNPHFPPDEYDFKEVSNPVKIDKNTAVNSARRIIGAKSSSEAADISAILVQLTNKIHPQIAGSSVILKNYPVWIITFYDVYLTAHGGPKVVNGSAVHNSSREVLADINVFIDANTGEDLQTISYSVFNQSEAIRKVLELHPDSGFPDKPGKLSGILHAGGMSPGLSIPAEFETKAEKESDGVYIITLTQFWNSKDLRGPNSKGPILSYFWKYRVTKDSINKIDKGGDNTPLIMK